MVDGKRQTVDRGERVGNEHWGESRTSKGYKCGKRHTNLGLVSTG